MSLIGIMSRCDVILYYVLCYVVEVMIFLIF